jgi:hypothetical protein
MERIRRAVLNPEEQVGVDRSVITFNSDGKQGVLEFKREREREREREMVREGDHRGD